MINPTFLELIEVLPVGPIRNKLRIADEHTWRIFMRLQNSHRFTTLYKQRFIVLQYLEGSDNIVKRFKTSGSFATATIDNEVAWPFRYFRI